MIQTVEFKPLEGDPPAKVSVCPFCGAAPYWLLIEARDGWEPTFYHPGVATDTDCVMSGKGFSLAEVAAWNRRTASRPSPTEEMVERVARAREAVSAARLSLARLADYAVAHCPGLTDQSPVITNALNAIHSLDVAFPSDTDMGTGLKIGAQ